MDLRVEVEEATGYWLQDWVLGLAYWLLLTGTGDWLLDWYWGDWLLG